MKLSDALMRSLQDESPAASMTMSGFGAGTATQMAPVSQPTAAELAKRIANMTPSGAQPSPREFERIMENNDLVDEFYLRRALAAANPVCRLILRNGGGRELGCATGFMVSPRLLLTNWHVFSEKEDVENAIAEFNYRLGVDGRPETSYRFSLKPDGFFLSFEDLDYALVEVAGTDETGAKNLTEFGYLRLMPQPGKILEGEFITIIEHPGGAPRQYSVRENQLIRKDDTMLLYRSDTAPGSSGSPAFNDQFQVVALHHTGQAKRDGAGRIMLRDGRAVDSFDGVDDSQVVWEGNSGIRVSVLCQDMKNRIKGDSSSGAELLSIVQQERGDDVMAKLISAAPTGSAEAARSAVTMPVASGSAGIVIPLQFQVSFSVNGAPGAPANPSPATVATVVTSTEQEKLVTIPVDTDYGSRTGYDEQFLGLAVPLPRVTDETVVSRLDDGTFVIPYEHFSVVMNKKRRLALFTASNVDGRPKSTKPADAGDLSRKGLTGLGKNDQEGWVTDPRIPENHQLPDVFYNKDRASFDKGHIVRREDVCFGDSYDQIVRANNDTFHTTNCSPQVADFNRSNLGPGEWGKLENFIHGQDRQEKYCIFAGPVFTAADPVFEGVDRRGKVKVSIPSSFWKIVIARKDNRLQAFAFLLEQDLSDVKFKEAEFQVTAQWKQSQISIASLEAKLAGVQFPAEVKAADQKKV